MAAYVLLPVVFSASTHALAEDSTTKRVTGSGTVALEEPEELLRRSIEMIEGRHSISAEVTHCIDIFGQKLVGKGTYCEQRSGPHPLVRFELKTPTGDSESLLLQVCDGRHMWNYRVLMGQPRLDRVDLELLAKTVRRRGGAGQGGTGLGDTITLGGIPALLRSIQESFAFDLAESESLYDMPVWRLRGRWRPARLATLLPEQAEAIQQGRVVSAAGEVDLTRLPERLPDHIYIWLGKDDLFPYRIEYCRTENGSGESRAIVAMQFLQVSFNVPLDPKCFVFRPGSVPVTDRTSECAYKIVRRARNLAAVRTHHAPRDAKAL
jgi:hypothetical protein